MSILAAVTINFEHPGSCDDKFRQKNQNEPLCAQNTMTSQYKLTIQALVRVSCIIRPFSPGYYPVGSNITTSATYASHCSKSTPSQSYHTLKTHKGGILWRARQDDGWPRGIPGTDMHIEELSNVLRLVHLPKRTQNNLWRGSLPTFPDSRCEASLSEPLSTEQPRVAIPITTVLAVLKQFIKREAPKKNKKSWTRIK